MAKGTGGLLGGGGGIEAGACRVGGKGTSCLDLFFFSLMALALSIDALSGIFLHTLLYYAFREEGAGLGLEGGSRARTLLLGVRLCCLLLTG